MCGAPQSSGACQETPKTEFRSAAEESVDEELSLHQSRQSCSFRDSSKGQWVGRAEAAWPSSHFLYSKPPLGSFTKVSWAIKAKPSEGTPQGPIDRGLAAVYFGANSVASALNLPQERDLPKNHPHSKPYLSASPTKQDISTLQRLGHFYFALTTQNSTLSSLFRNVPRFASLEVSPFSISIQHSFRRCGNVGIAQLAISKRCGRRWETR